MRCEGHSRQWKLRLPKPKLQLQDGEMDVPRAGQSATATPATPATFPALSER